MLGCGSYGDFINNIIKLDISKNKNVIKSFSYKMNISFISVKEKKTISR